MKVKEEVGGWTGIELWELFETVPKLEMQKGIDYCPVCCAGLKMFQN